MNNTAINRTSTDRTEYAGELWGSNNGVFFKLGLTIAEVNEALEENKKFHELEDKYNEVYATCSDLAFENRELKAKILKASVALH